MNQAPIPPPSYQRTMATALHLDALTLVTRLHLLEICGVAVRLTQQQCPPPLPAGPGGAPRVYREATLLLVALRCCGRSGACRIKRFMTGCAPGRPWRWPAGRHWDQMAGRVCPARRSRPSVCGPPAPHPAKCSSCCWCGPGYGGGVSRTHRRDLIIASAPSWPSAAAAIPMLLSVMRSPTIPVRCCWAIGCIPCCVVAQACHYFVGSPPPKSTMPLRPSALGAGCPTVRGAAASHPPGRGRLGSQADHLDPCHAGAVAVIPWSPKCQKQRDGLPQTGTAEELGKRISIERFFGRVLVFFRLQRPSVFGWSAVETRVALTYAAVWEGLEFCKTPSSNLMGQRGTML